MHEVELIELIRARLASGVDVDYLKHPNVLTPHEGTVKRVTLVALEVLGIRVAIDGNVEIKTSGDAERWFSAGVRAREDGDSSTTCPFPEDSDGRHWWSRGFAYSSRLFRAIDAESQLAAQAAVTEPGPAPVNRESRRRPGAKP